MTSPNPDSHPGIGAAPPLYTRLVESGYALLARTTRLDAWRHFQALQSSQWLEPDRVRALQWEKLRHLLRHCFENVPFYRRLWREAGVDPTKFSAARDLENLPTVDKLALMAGQRRNDFLLDGKRGLEKVHTSGTTGPRFHVLLTLADFQKKYANHLRQVCTSGWRLGMKSAALYYSGHPQFEGRYTGRGETDSFVAFRKLALFAAHRRISLVPYHDAIADLDALCRDWYDRLSRYRPYLFETMEFNLPVLIDYIERNDLPPLRIPVIYLLGTLSTSQRERYRAFFGADVYNRYSPHEMEGIAFACSVHDGLHVASESYCVEFLDDAKRPVPRGELGQVTVTDLDNFTMPLIRYQVGDVGYEIGTPCPCGRGLPRMGDIAGRARDVLRVHGIAVAPYRINAVLQDRPDVVLFQVRQISAAVLCVDIVAKDGADRQALSADVRAGLAGLFEDKADVSLRYVEHIPLEPNGKICLTKGLAG